MFPNQNLRETIEEASGSEMNVLQTGFASDLLFPLKKPAGVFREIIQEKQKAKKRTGPEIVRKRRKIVRKRRKRKED